MTIKEFIHYWDKKVEEASEKELLKMYDKTFHLILDETEVSIPFDAVSFNTLIGALKTIYDET